MQSFLDAPSTIVPLIGIRDGNMRPGNPATFLGTASFVGPGGLLLTADHVIRDWEHELCIVTTRGASVFYPATVLERDEAHDLALLRVPTYAPAQYLVPAFDRRIAGNVPVLTHEYGTTKASQSSIDLNPATRMGNVTRVFNMPMLGPAGDDALELSFSALKGASGAPVVTGDTFGLWGVIVANVSYELLPCQIESVLDEKNQLLEETKFMLPQAAAVNVRHLKSMYLRHVLG